VNARASTRAQLAATLAFAAVLTAGLTTGTVLFRSTPGCYQVLIASSQEKATMLKDFALAYNRGGPQVGGRCVAVKVEEVRSGDAELALARGWTGPTRPDVWLPASSAWVKMLASQLSPETAARTLPVSSNSLFQSPLVIGMPAPMAAALDYPAKPVGWARILQLARDPRGWGAFGHADWGPFKLGKTNPTISTSGLHALIGAYYAAPGGANLTADSVASAPVQDFVRQIESSVVHYGQTATGFLRNLRYEDDQSAQAALQYISAIAVEEKELADYNAGLVAGVQRSAPRVKLVAVYPAGGTQVANHPYVVLGWATDAQRAVAREFESFIRAQKTTIEGRHFRFDDPTQALAELVSKGAVLPPLVAMEPPPGKVIGAMIQGWKLVRKAARVLILIDAAVAADALKSATKALAHAVSGFLPQDRVGIWTFPAIGGQPGSHSVALVVTQDKGSLSTVLAKVSAVSGPSDLDGALHDAVTAMRSSYDSTVIDAVLVLDLSPGGEAANSELIRFLSSRAPIVRVFTIGPSSQRLQLIALAGGGAFYEVGSASQFLDDAISNF
jgi:Ca-activated chloride channel homolog